MQRSSVLALLPFLLLAAPAWVGAMDSTYISNLILDDSVPVTTWKELRDSRIVKQDLDYSCGAASIATLLNEHYGQSVAEEEILQIMDKGEMRASFDDMASALTEIGFKGIGYAASYAQLTKLKIPVIVYTKHRKDDHFAVLRGIDEHTVWIADPSLGNMTYSKHQFLEMWETRGEATLKGKILAVLPNDDRAVELQEFFTNQPRRKTGQAVLQQAFRRGH